MSRRSLESVTGRENANGILQEIESTIGKVDSLEQVGGGLVHYVYRVETSSRSAYLKIRSNHYSGIPNILTQPGLIRDEKRAIELFSTHSAEYFPEILLYNSILHYLLLSDVMPSGTTLDRLYQQSAVSPKDLHEFGRAVGDIHTNTLTKEPVRSPNDKQYQNNLMKYALESYEHPALVAAASEHRQRETQLLVGDLSPKNTYLQGEIVRLCDLENAHQGALPYDQAFVLAHILLHHETQKTAISAMWAFISGYEKVGGKIDQGDNLLTQTLHGILLYRLSNPVIPYELPFKPQRKKQMAINVFSSLNQNLKDLEVVVANLFKK